MEIAIDTGRCIRCGRCAKVCPSLVFGQEKAGTEVQVVAPENCIVCGHCVAACPTAAVRHADFPPERVHPVDRAQLPSPEQLMSLCRARRSNRALSRKPVPQEFLDRILEAAHRAPTASNLQQVGFTVLSAPDDLRFVVEYTLGFCRRMLRLLEMPVLGLLVRKFVPGADRYRLTFRRLIDEYEKGGRDRILRGATALIFIHTPAKNRFGAIDCQLAYQNGSLMAEALGVSQIYTGFVLTASRSDRRNRLARRFGIEGSIHAGMALGMPEFLFPNCIDKKPLDAIRK
ncbi:MAG: nitroreductase family protein [Alistipes sp.]|nr:nitroreductase family protein [Alistipes senegalensis]MCM1250887.1 nitroreductase family protein [Alistipes sp.]